jgi:RimJ/RimL family protein N-acetyltransferase
MRLVSGVPGEIGMLPELRTDRLVLREITPEDGPALQAFQNRPEQWQLQAVEPEELADSTLRIKRYFEYCGPEEARRLYFYLARKISTHAVVGQVSLSRFFHPALASLSFGVASEHWGRGYATEMAQCVLSFGFCELGLHRISADIAIENQASRAVVEKTGMVHEGTARECIWAQGRWWSEARYAILRADFERREQALKRSAACA